MHCPITAEDSVVVRGKRLYKRDGSVFTVRGIAFPTPPDGVSYNASSWLDILRQLRDLDLQFNAVRMYRMDPTEVDYSEFIEGAAQLGVYLIVPLTAASGDGVLDRTLPAPKCYTKGLFNFGASTVTKYLQYPNVLGGVVGNEIMNDDTSWLAAPCVRGYARNLKLFMDTLVKNGQVPRTLPLIYAAQDSSVLGGAAMDSDTIVKLTADYLTCAESGKGTIINDVAGESIMDGKQRFTDNRFGISPIDIVGVNIESWCSSTQNFYHNPDGTRAAYFSLWKALQNTSVPVIFSEMGCPHQLFDRDDHLHRTGEGTRDWAQVGHVMNAMNDTIQGFIAYTYDGAGNDFEMFGGGPWDGQHVLRPTEDFRSFKDQLAKLPNDDELSLSNEQVGDILPRRCSAVEADFISCCDLRLFNDDKIQTFTSSSESVSTYTVQIMYVGLLLALFPAFYAVQKRFVSRGEFDGEEYSSTSQNGSSSNGSTKYMSIGES